MQQVTAGEISVFPKIQVEQALHRFRRKPKPFLLAHEVLVQRDHRRRLGNLTERLANHELATDERERCVGAAAQHGARGLHELGEAGERAAAQRRERFREPSRVDDLGG